MNTDKNKQDQSPPSDGLEEEVYLDPKIQAALGRSLKAHYDDLVNAPIPDKFLVLLAQLEAKERSSHEN